MSWSWVSTPSSTTSKSHASSDDTVVRLTRTSMPSTGSPSSARTRPPSSAPASSSAATSMSPDAPSEQSR